METTRRGFLEKAGTAAGATAAGGKLGHAHEHEHEHRAAPSDLTLRVKSLESLLVEKGLVEKVRARNLHPITHTRLPRYARGKIGTVTRDHGVFVFPDTNAHLLGENPQHVYSVRITARELWGEDRRREDSVQIDLWDDYLDPA